VVFGRQDPRRGTIFVAYVISRTSFTLEELDAHCSTHFPPEQVPTLLVLTRSFPEGLTDTGRRLALQERFRQMLARGK
jgi:hypothetical protein